MANAPQPAQPAPAYKISDYITGRLRVPPDVLALEQRNYTYAADTNQNATSPLVNGLIASAGSATLQINVDDSAYFLVEQIQMLSSLQTVSMDKALVQITDQTTARSWSDVAVPMRDLAGIGNTPKYLSDPQLLRPTSTVNVQITNNTGSSAAFYIALIGRKIYGMTEAQANLMFRRSWFQYTIPFSNGLAASAIGVHAQCKVYNESDFLIKKILSTQAIAAIFAATGGAESQEIMAMLKDTNGDRNYFNQKMPLRLIAGGMTGPVTSVANSWANGSPESLLKPIPIRRNCVIDMECDNKATSVIGAFQVTLEGCRMFQAA